MSILAFNESVLKDRISKVYLRQLEVLYGTDIRIRKQKKDVFSKVYGVQSGIVDESYDEVRAVVTGLGFTTTDKFSSSMVQAATMYSAKDFKLNTADQLEIKRTDGKFYKYKVESISTIGITIDIIYRYELVALG